MSVATIILGESGAGKSTSLRNLDPGETIVLQAVQKPLPFKATAWKPWSHETKTGSRHVTDNPGELIGFLQNVHRCGKKVIVLDDCQYVMANEFMRRSKEKGFEKFNEIGKNFWDIMNAASAAPEDVRVYLLWHIDRDDQGNIRAKTIGKMLNDKITVEGMFSIVLRCQCIEGQHLFSTKTNGSDTVKSPIGMFDRDLIPNDLAEVDRAICDFYGINPTQKGSSHDPISETTVPGPGTDRGTDGPGLRRIGF